ncbi:hypothetical protein BH10ACI1_BH10ACI1_34430 [soil metagenome]
MKKYLLFAFFLTLFSATINASEPSIWSVNSRADVLKGDAKGVSISDNGEITLAPKLTEVFKTDQSYIWSSAIDASGNIYLGTGSDGKIFKVDASGKGSLFYDSAELNVAAMAIGKAGEIYAGTSPDGKVYRIDASGNASVFFEPKEKYIWSLAVLADGSLAVGTGETGKIFKVKSANATPETSLLFDTSENHIISLAADKNGNLYAGTDSNGLVLRFSADGKAFALLDSPLREIHDLAIGTDGSVYALALSETITAPKPEATTTAATTSSTISTDDKQAEMPTKSRYDLSAAKSVLYRISPDGGNNIIWNSATVVGFSIYANQAGNGVFLGTSDKGRIYNISNAGRETLVLQSGEGQISTIKSNGQNIFATSSNQGKLFRFGAESNAEGIYESAVLDAKTVADWGRIWWRSSGNVTLQTRSGNTEKPTETWSDWSASVIDQKGAQISSPKAKYLQWRAILKGTATLNEITLSYLAGNIAPEILSIQILPTNVGLAANPAMQIDPNIENSGIDLSVFGLQNPVVPPRRVYQRGARSILWTAEDRNGDKLEYDVYYRETGETTFKLLHENLRDNFFTIDGSSLPDGRYIFKIVAKDSPSNPLAKSLSGERLSEPFNIDNTAPTVTLVGTPQITGDKVKIVVDATETASYLTRAEYSINGGDWQTIYADDGISDGTKERYTLDILVKTKGENTIAFRVFDANGNIGSIGIPVKK